MPTPFMCHGCDKPTMNKSGVCDDCAKWRSWANIVILKKIVPNIKTMFLILFY